MGDDCAFCTTPLMDDQAARCPLCGTDFCSEECLTEHLGLPGDLACTEDEPVAAEAGHLAWEESE